MSEAKLDAALRKEAAQEARRAGTTIAMRKIRALLLRYSQRELSKKTSVPQPTICLINTGARMSPRQSTRRKFEKVGVKLTDWET